MDGATEFDARETGAGGVAFAVRVVPRAKRDAIEGTMDGALKVRLKAPPVEGQANEALRRFLAERLNIPRAAVTILSGESSRRKRVAVNGVKLERILALARSDPHETAGKTR